MLKLVQLLLGAVAVDFLLVATFFLVWQRRLAFWPHLALRIVAVIAALCALVAVYLIA